MLKIIFIILFSIVQNACANSNSSIDVCFTPGDDCAQQIIDTVDKAKKQILVQAYSFTSPPIAKSLINAKKRGVDVEILLDKSQLRERYSMLMALKQSIPVLIDYKPTIAHNKIIIIDGYIVITGSYNFTNAAQKHNAENLLIIRDKELADKYKINWYKRHKISK